MRNDAVEPRPAYSKPSLEVLGSFAGLTLLNFNPDKWSSFADLSQGINNAIADGGIGS